MKYLPIASLIVSNLVPLWGVVFYNWSVSSLMWAYWSETVVICTYTIAKMQRSSLALPPHKDAELAVMKGSKTIYLNTKSLIIKHFIILYGSFTLGHALFLIFIFSMFDLGTNQPLELQQILLTTFLLIISHGVSYLINFIGKKEFLNVTAQQLFNSPGHRIILLQFVVIMGGAPVLAFNGHIVLLCLFIVLKIIIDISLHKNEHNLTQATNQTIETHK